MNVNVSVPPHEEVTVSPVTTNSFIVTPPVKDLNNNYEQQLAQGLYNTPANPPYVQGGGVQ